MASIQSTQAQKNPNYPVIRFCKSKEQYRSGWFKQGEDAGTGLEPTHHMFLHFDEYIVSVK
ncbi:hypothetical protein LguiB_012852 [Lonicera macranthoides]